VQISQIHSSSWIKHEQDRKAHRVLTKQVAKTHQIDGKINRSYGLLNYSKYWQLVCWQKLAADSGRTALL